MRPLTAGAAPIRVRLTPGNEADVTQAGVLLFGLRPKAVVADKAYDSDGLVGSIRRRKGRAVIPPKSNRVRFRWYDRTLYRERNKIERFFNRLKDFRCCAMAGKIGKLIISSYAASAIGQSPGLVSKCSW